LFFVGETHAAQGDGEVCGTAPRISEIVDVPNWTVGFYFPRIVFE
jgi:acetamidase/formamidase